MFPWNPGSADGAGEGEPSEGGPRCQGQSSGTAGLPNEPLINIKFNIIIRKEQTVFSIVFFHRGPGIAASIGKRRVCKPPRQKLPGASEFKVL